MPRPFHPIGLARLDAAASFLSDVARGPDPNESAPTIPTVYHFGGQRLSLFGTITHFSTVNDEMLADLKVELVYPSDQSSATWLAEHFEWAGCTADLSYTEFSGGGQAMRSRLRRPCQRAG